MSLFGTDGVRCRAGEGPLTPSGVAAIAAAAVRASREASPDGARCAPKVLIAKDTRVSGHMIESALTAGFTAAADVRIHDPNGRHDGETLLADAVWTECPMSAAVHADVLVVLTEWSRFRAIDPGLLATVMHGRVIVDLRNHLERDPLHQRGFHVASIGRFDLAPPHPSR